MPREESPVQRIRRLKFIVARDRKDLFESLRRTFSGDDSVEVVLDRRGGERRAKGITPSTERRRRERRFHRAVARNLEQRGYAVVGVLAASRARSARA
jgi:hypothetical protein